MITLRRFRKIEAALIAAGFGDDHNWAEQLSGPTDPDAFARAAINVVCNSGMRFAIAREIFSRCMKALEKRGTVRRVFGHPDKARAIDFIWAERSRLFQEFHQTEDQLDFCASLPWVGPITKYHLAKDLGLDVAKPDVHLARLAARDRTSVQRLCAKLARKTGYRVATIDTILWRACATGILDSARYANEGWRPAFRSEPTIEH